METARRLESVQIGMTASPSHLSGTDRYYLELLQYLPACGVSVRGMVIGEPEKLDGGMPGVRSFAKEGDSRVARWRRSRVVFRELVRGSDIVVSHGQAHAFPVLDLIGRRPLVVQFHGPWALEAQASGAGRGTVFVRMVQERAVYRGAVRFIALSRSFGDILVREYGVDENRLRIVPGGVDARFHAGTPRSEARERLGLPADRPIIASTRRLEPTKGVADLIGAMTDVGKKLPDALCILTGTGSLRAELEERVASAGLTGTVRFLGHVDAEALRLVYRAADLTVVPSVAWEGFGLSVIESLASGTPVIATRVGGLPEVLTDLDPSAIVAPRDPSGLADRIVLALGGEISSEEDCVRYARRFSWPEIAAKIAGVYREAAG